MDWLRKLGNFEVLATQQKDHLRVVFAYMQCHVCLCVVSVVTCRHKNESFLEIQPTMHVKMPSNSFSSDVFIFLCLSPSYGLLVLQAAPH